MVKQKENGAKRQEMCAGGGTHRSEGQTALTVLKQGQISTLSLAFGPTTFCRSAVSAEEVFVGMLRRAGGGHSTALTLTDTKPQENVQVRHGGR